jgi:leader peptidase (prepilin peptidase) / N-methyltransferase
VSTALLSHGWLIALLALWIALAVGSFLNVLIYRLPVMLDRQWRAQSAELLQAQPLAPPAHEGPFNLFVPRSRCVRCGTQIRAVDNIPILSWLWLRGRCAACSAPISARYPLVEALTAVCSLAVIEVYGFEPLCLGALAFTWIAIALTFIDLDTKLLPDALTYSLLWLGLACNIQGAFTDLASAVIGAMTGYLFLYGVYWTFKLLTGKEGMGYGDFKLLAALGAWFGWQALPMLVLLSSLVGVVVGGGYLLLRHSREPIPFGPYLAIAGWVALITHGRVVAPF